MDPGDYYGGSQQSVKHNVKFQINFCFCVLQNKDLTFPILAEKRSMANRFCYTFLVGHRTALTCAMLWLRISQQWTKAHGMLTSQSSFNLWKDPNNNGGINPDVWSTAGLVPQHTAESLSQPLPPSTQPLLRENQELSNRRSCDLSLRAGVGQLNITPMLQQGEEYRCVFFFHFPKLL